MKKVLQSKSFPCACTLLLCILPSFAILKKWEYWAGSLSCAVQSKSSRVGHPAPALPCVGTTETCNLDIWEETDSFFPPLYNWTWNSLDIMVGAALVEPTLLLCRSVWGAFGTQPVPPATGRRGVAGCSAYLSVSWAGFGETSRTRTAVGAKEAFATLWFLRNKANILFSRALVGRQCTEDTSPSCFGPLAEACRGSWLLKGLCWTRTTSATATLKPGGASPREGMHRLPDPSLAPIRLIRAGNPCPVTRYERACVHLLVLCALSCLPGGVRCNSEAGSLLCIRDQELEDVFHPREMLWKLDAPPWSSSFSSAPVWDLATTQP